MVQNSRIGETPSAAEAPVAYTVSWRDDRPAPGPVKVSIVMITYARDGTAGGAIDRLATVTGTRSDVEFILVDNNADEVDRDFLTRPFQRAAVVRMARNKGVSARNDGAAQATGDFILFMDDDNFLHPDTALDVYDAAFADQPDLAIVTARYIDHATGTTLRRFFPHTDKKKDKTQPFHTFRFQGSASMMRKTAWDQIGPMSTEFFYGLEEIDYAYRVISAGWKIQYEPRAWAVEYNEPSGRLPTATVQKMRVTNKFIISYKWLPALYLPMNFVLFGIFAFVQNRGRVDVPGAFVDFMRWRRANPGARQPLSAQAQAYIRACGGHVWK